MSASRPPRATTTWRSSAAKCSCIDTSCTTQLQLVEYESKYQSKKLQAKRCKDDADWTEFEREDSIESNVLADTFEAVMGAIFLDAKEDLDTVNRIVTRLGLFASVVAV